MTQQLFNMCRIHSLTRPGLGVGMIERYATGVVRYFTHEQLESLTAKDLGFYIDDFLMQQRGEERHDEQFVLQGGLNHRDWVDIKPINPLPGEGPEPDYGNCMQCGSALEEAEFAIGDICDGCRPAFMEEYEARREAEIELAAERSRYPE
jgi:hypothetical protein